MSVQSSLLDPRFLALLLDSLLRVVTDAEAEDETARRDLARTLFEAFTP